MKKWTREEEIKLEENYPLLGYKVIEMFPGRSKSSILRKADWLNLKVNRKARKEIKEDRIGYLDIECCVTPDTLVLTKTGLNYITEIKSGDTVLTHKNRWKKVTAISKRLCEGKVYDLYHTTGMPLLSITPSHPLWVVETRTNKRGAFDKGGLNTKTFSNPIWKNGEDLKNTDLTTSLVLDENEWHDITEISLGNRPKNDHWYSHSIPNKMLVTDVVLQMIGAFLGDGWCCAGKSNSVSFFANENDKDFIDLIESFEKQMNFSFSRKKEEKMWKFNVCSKQLADFFIQFYNKNGEKDLPLSWLNLPTKRFEKIIDGLVMSDGYISKKGVPSISNSSAQLFKKIQVRMMFSKTSIRIFKKSNTLEPKFRGARIHSRKPAYSICIYDENKKHIRRWYILGFSLNRILFKQERNYSDSVYNIEVEDDNSYIANGIISHNSQLSADFGIVYSWTIKEAGTNHYDSALITREELLDGTLDKRLIQEFLEKVKRYTKLITYYGSKFDIPYLRTRALIHGLGFIPYGEIVHEDLYYSVKSKLRIHRNRLETACDTMGIEGKTHIKPMYWIRAGTGDEKSLDYIHKHNIADTMILEKLHEKLVEYGARTQRWL
jgi:intein/homing endonuclease